jgi:hypothetical protein
MHSTFFPAVTVGLLAVCLPICGDPPKDDQDPSKLVRDLGSPRFAVREAAEQKLVALGSKAKAAVVAGTKGADAEVTRRCEAILPKIRSAERQALVDNGVWPSQGGETFRKLVGETREARRLFALMTEDDHYAALADAATADPAGAAKLYAAEVARLAEAVERIPNMGIPPGAAGREMVLGFARDKHREEVGWADVTLVLYLGSFALPEGTPDPEKVARLLGPSFFDLATSPVKQPFARLFSAWLDRRRDPRAVTVGLEVALATGLAEVVPAARRWVANPKASGPAVGTAALVLGTHGSKDDLAALSALRGDRRVYRGPPGRDFEIDVSEVAAAMSLVLRGEEPASYGFKRVKHREWWADPAAEVFPTPDAFESPEARTAALKTAWEWLDQQPGAPPKRGK